MDLPSIYIVLNTFWNNLTKCNKLNTDTVYFIKTKKYKITKIMNQDIQRNITLQANVLLLNGMSPEVGTHIFPTHIFPLHH